MLARLCCTLLLCVGVALAPRPAAAASPEADSPAAHTETLRGAVPLEVRLPAGYELKTEHDDTLEIFHIWRTPPVPLPRDTSLAIIVGRFRTPYCPPGTGHTEPAAFAAWHLRWHVCNEAGTQATVWETFVSVPAHDRIVQIAIIGSDAAEAQRLRAIAETLRPAGG